MSQFGHVGIDLPCAWPLRIENEFRVVEDYQHLLQGEGLLQGGQVLRVLDPCANGLGEATEELVVGGLELVAMNKSTVLAKTLFDSVVVEGGQGNR